MEDEQQQTSGPNDSSKVREVEFNGVTYTLETSDPYGYWHVKWKGKKQRPVELAGVFTSPHAAELAIELYSNKTGPVDINKIAS